MWMRVLAQGKHESCFRTPLHKVPITVPKE